MSKNYSTTKSQHVQKEMAKGISNKKANRSWSHSKNNLRQQWINAHPDNSTIDNYEYYKSDRPEMSDYAYTADDL